MIIALLLPDHYIIITSLLQMGNHVIMIALLRVVQRVSLHYYILITYYYAIIKTSSIITVILPIITYFSLPNLHMVTQPVAPQASESGRARKLAAFARGPVARAGLT